VLIGLDIGTSGARALAVRESGEVVAVAAQEYPLHTPRPGWTEQNPEDWWEASRKVLAEVARAVGGDVVAIGLTGQMHGSVFLDAEDRVIRPALLWNDQRTAAQCSEITERVGRERLLAIAGNPALTGFQAPKVLWLREVEPGNYARVARVLLPKDFIRLHLAGEYATDASDASGTLLLDLRRRDWSAEILEALELPREWMPVVREGPEEAGRLRADVASELGLPAESRSRRVEVTMPRLPSDLESSRSDSPARQLERAECSLPTRRSSRPTLRGDCTRSATRSPTRIT